MTTKQPEYTPAIETIMETVYTGAETDQERANAVQALVKQLGNTSASIRSKLVRMELYIKPEKAGKTSAKKAILVAQIADEMDKEEEDLESLEKCNKNVLQAIISHYELLNRIITELEEKLKNG